MYGKYNILGYQAIRLLGYWLLVIIMISCRGEEVVVPSEYVALPISPRQESSFAPNEPIGMYLLNEGNMGSNKATIDYIDFSNGFYIRNIYGERNPNVIKELGDVGNDIQVYGNRLYAVINCSHKVEVMDARTCRRIGQVDIPNCRYICFHEGKAYVSSYVGPVSIDPNAQLGAIFEIDTATLQITRKVTVGYQPEELVINGEYLYVVNSGGYRAPNYDSTMSVVSLKISVKYKKYPYASILTACVKTNIVSCGLHLAEIIKTFNLYLHASHSYPKKYCPWLKHQLFQRW